MTEVSLHAMPRWRDVVLEQIRIVGLGLRREALVIAVVLLIGTVIIGVEVARGGAGFDADDPFPTAVVAFLLPFAVWRNEKRFGAAFLWNLPVDRRRMALTRVLAGFVWLMAALAVFAIWLLTLMLFAGASPAEILARIPFIATIGTYLLASALVLGLRHPLRWLLGTAGVFFLVGGVHQTFERLYGQRTLLGSSGLYVATSSTFAAWQTLPDSAQWAISTSLWLGAGLAALWAAASRHRERRRQ